MQEPLVVDQIAASINHQINSYFFFMDLAEKTANPDVKELCQSLADDEEQHINTLRDLHAQVFEGKELPNLKELAATRHFDRQAIMKLMQRLDRKGKLADKLESSARLDLMDMASIARITTEDNIEFYQKVAGKVENYRTKKFYQRLVEAEKEKLEDLTARISQLETGGQWDRPRQYYWDIDPEG